jgi:hypothetical protein
MRLVVVFIAVYLLIAVFYVWRDMLETNVVREAFYIGRYRRDRHLIPLIWIALLWLPVTAHSFYVDRLRPRELITLSFFLVALATIWLISN